MTGESQHSLHNERADRDPQVVVDTGPAVADGAPPPSPPPPRGPSVGVTIGMLVVFFVALATGVLCSDRIRSVARNLSGDDVAAVEQYYTCGMHPWVLQQGPGVCPVCKMKLEPVDPASLSGGINISPVVVQNIGVRVEPVTTGPLVKTIRTVGTVDYAEPLVKDVNTKIGGWIEKLYVDQMGQPVKAGDPLFELYSPELYAAQEEYLLAWRNRRRAEGAAVDASEQFLQSARTKLAYFDISPQQIQALEQAGEPSKTMTIRSPHTGVVTEKNVYEGMRIEPGVRALRIADLSRVWVMVSIYEYQLPFVQEGQTALMTLPYIPGQTLEGKVVYVYPFVNQQVREITVRLEFDNSNGLLKPGMFANVELQNTLARQRVLAPRSAIIDTGKRQVAFVSLGEGRFEPRDVQIGVETADGMVEVRDGLKPGELVVTSGQFLLDSEARIREARAKMIRGDLAAEQQAVVAVAGTSELESLPGPMALALGRLLDHYMAIGEKLAADTHAGTDEPARGIASAVGELLEVQIPSHPQFWQEHEEVATVRGKALEVVSADNLEDVRLAYADLSIALAKLLRATGIPPTYGRDVQQLHCPMYREGQGGGTWLQIAGRVRNPFYGSVMLECFDKRETLPVTGGTPALPDEVSAPATGDPAVVRQVDQLVGGYLRLQQLLAQETVDTAAVAGRFVEMAAVSRQLGGALEREAAALVGAIANAVGTVDASTAPDAMRETFAVVSDNLLKLTGYIPPSTAAAPSLNHAYCPMVRKAWLQVGEDISNPYDPDMPTCGFIERPIPLQAVLKE